MTGRRQFSFADDTADNLHDEEDDLDFRDDLDFEDSDDSYSLVSDDDYLQEEKQPTSKNYYQKINHEYDDEY